MTTKTDKRERLRCPDCARGHRTQPKSLDEFFTWIDPSTGEQRRSVYCKVHMRKRRAAAAKSGATSNERLRARLNPSSPDYDALAHERQKKSKRESMRRAREQLKVSSTMMDSNWVYWVDDQGVEHYTPLAQIVDVKRAPSGSVFVTLDELEIDERYAGETLMSAASQSVEYRVSPEHATALLWYLSTRRCAARVLDLYEKHQQSQSSGTK